MIELTVIGTPSPQGSKAFKGLSRTGRAILAESSKGVASWRQVVTVTAYNARKGQCWPVLEGPLRVRMTFSLRRPQNAPKRVLAPATQPDLSKLVRAVEDSLQDAGIFANDGQIVEYVRLAKVFAGSDDPDALDVPGVKLTIFSAEE